MMNDLKKDTNHKMKICPACNNEVDMYLPFGVKPRPNALCPHCYSLERHRALWLYFEQNSRLFRNNAKILHFAPERVFLNKFSNMTDIDYYPVDLNPAYKGIRMPVDITKIPLEDDFFDIILCNHVLEHIPEEEKALSELRRVLKPSGIAFLNSPVSSNETTLEKPEYNTPELREKYYGQADHVRLYGQDYRKRLMNAGFRVNKIFPNSGLSMEELQLYGLLQNEIFFECTVD